MKTHTKTVIFVFGFLLGIVIGEVSGFGSEVAVMALVISLVQGGIIFVERKRNTVSSAIGTAHCISFPLITILLTFGLFFGVVRSQLVEPKINFVCETSCIFEARIISSPENKNDYQNFNVHPVTESEEVYGIQIRTPLYPKYKIGETVKISGKVTVPEIIPPHGQMKSPASRSGGFDYVSYLRTKNVGSEMTYPHIEVVDEDAHTLPLMLGRWKENLVTRTDMYVSSPASTLASGMLFGASSISKDLAQTFRTAGLSHIIVLSGFNIAVLISFILFVFAFLPLVSRIIFASLFVISFVVMVGGEASVIRATIMSFISLLAVLVGRKYAAKQALILSLFAIVMYDPYSLTHDVSLHLSFLATAGIIYLTDPIEIIVKKYFTSITSQTLQELFVTTLAAYLSTLPYIMYTFGTVSIYALIANILVLPFVPIAMLLSFLVVVSSYIASPLSLVFGFIDTVIIDVIIWVARTIELLPLSLFSLTVSFSTMCFMYIFFVLTVKYFSVKQKDETFVTTSNGNLTDVISY